MEADIQKYTENLRFHLRPRVGACRQLLPHRYRDSVVTLVMLGTSFSQYPRRLPFPAFFLPICPLTTINL